MRLSKHLLGTDRGYLEGILGALRGRASVARLALRVLPLQFFLLQLVVASAQLNSPVWSHRYSGEGTDEARDIAVSPDGLVVYVTGYTEKFIGYWDKDIITAAYDIATGQQLWCQVHEDEGFYDEGVSVVVSPDSSRVYVTASSFNGMNNDYLIIAYNARTGNVLWTYRYNPYDEDDRPLDMTISPDGRYVYVTGESFVPSQDYNYATIAIRTIDGQLEWQQLYNGPHSSRSRDSGVGIEISPDGSRVFVAGQTIGLEPVGNDPPPNLSVIAYNAISGEQLWVSVFDTPRSTNGGSYDIGIRRGGDFVYATGFGVDANTSRTVISTACYRADNGEHVWARRYDGNRGTSSAAYSVAAGQNYVFATGSDGAQRVTIAYGAVQGDIRWVSNLCSGYGVAVAVNHDESAVFVTGSGGYGNGVGTMATAAYDATTGEQLWAAFYEPIDLVGWGNSIALSPDGRFLFVAGMIDYDLSVVAYRSMSTIPDGDANADGCVDDADLLLVLFYFGLGQHCCGSPLDLNDDCSVDDADILEVILSFGRGCEP